MSRIKLFLSWAKKNIDPRSELLFFFRFNMVGLIAVVIAIPTSQIISFVLMRLGFPQSEASAIDYARWYSTIVVIAFGLRPVYRGLREILKNQQERSVREGEILRLLNQILEQADHRNPD